MSQLLLLLGLALLVGGGWELYRSEQGQDAARQEWEQLEAASATADARSLPQPGAVRLSVPRLDRQYFVLSGASRGNLSRGPAWLSTTGQPGKRGNCIIAGHRDTHFRFLKDIRKGDVVDLDTGGVIYRYRVTSTHVVSPRNRALLKPEEQPMLTLVTCYPFYYLGPAPKRFIVRAELVGKEPRSLFRQVRG